MDVDQAVGVCNITPRATSECLMNTALQLWVHINFGEFRVTEHRARKRVLVHQTSQQNRTTSTTAVIVPQTPGEVKCILNKVCSKQKVAARRNSLPILRKERLMKIVKARTWDAREADSSWLATVRKRTPLHEGRHSIAEDHAAAIICLDLLFVFVLPSLCFACIVTRPINPSDH